MTEVLLIGRGVLISFGRFSGMQIDKRKLNPTSAHFFLFKLITKKCTLYSEGYINPRIDSLAWHIAIYPRAQTCKIQRQGNSCSYPECRVTGRAHTSLIMGCKHLSSPKISSRLGASSIIRWAIHVIISVIPAPPHTSLQELNIPCLLIPLPHTRYFVSLRMYQVSIPIPHQSQNTYETSNNHHHFTQYTPIHHYLAVSE